MVCLPYDPLPYFPSRARTLGRTVLGKMPLAAEQLGSVIEIEAADGERASWAESVTSDDTLAAWVKPKGPAQQPKKVREPQPPQPSQSFKALKEKVRRQEPGLSKRALAALAEEVRRNEWFARNGLLRPSDVVRHGGPQPALAKSLPPSPNGELPKPSGRPEIERYGCAKIAFRSPNAAWNAVQRTIKAGEDDGEATLGFYRCSDCSKWHVGHAADREPQDKPLEFDYRLVGGA